MRNRVVTQGRVAAWAVSLSLALIATGAGLGTTVAAAGPVHHANTAGAAVAGAWKVRADFPAEATFRWVSCANTQFCEAVGSSGLSAVAGMVNGMPWKWQRLPTGDELSGVTCPASGVCFGWGQGSGGPVIVATTDSGARWTNQTTPSEVNTMQRISCGSSTSCVGFAQTNTGTEVVLTTSDGGAEWSTGALPSGMDVVQLNSVSCPTATRCEAVGMKEVNYTETTLLLLSTDGGATWTAQNTPAGAAQLGLDDIACSSATVCVAVGDTVLTTTNGGTTWVQQAGGPASILSQISCTSSTVCDAIGSDPNGNPVLYGTSDGGQTWSSESLPAGASEVTISCPPLGSCELVGTDGVLGALWRSSGTSTWTRQRSPFSASGLYGASCASTTVCLAVGDNSAQRAAGVTVATTTGASSWPTQVALPSTDSLQAVSCPSTTTCYAVGYVTTTGNALFASTTDGGAKWTTEAVRTSASDSLTSLSCPSTTECVAAGSDVNSSGQWVPRFYTTTDGTHWSPNWGPTSLDTALAVSCPTTSVCESVGNLTSGSGVGIIRSTNGGVTWKLQKSDTADNLLTLSCSGSTFCAVLGNNSIGNAGGLVTTNGGATWTATRMGVSGQIHSVSCSSATTCVAVGVGGTGVGLFSKLTTDAGASWSGVMVPSATGVLSSVSCPSTSFCLAAGSGNSDGGQVLTLTLP